MQKLAYLNLVLDTVSAHYDIPRDKLCPQGEAPLTTHQKIAVWLAARQAGHSVRGITSFFQLDGLDATRKCIADLNAQAKQDPEINTTLETLAGNLRKRMREDLAAAHVTYIQERVADRYMLCVPTMLSDTKKKISFCHARLLWRLSAN